MLKSSIENTAYNNEAAFKLDPLVQAIVKTTAENIVGGHLTVSCDDKEATEKIRAFNSSINDLNETIETWINDNWMDNNIHGHALWVIKYDPVMIKRVAPDTFKKEIDPLTSWMKFVQSNSAVPVFSSYDDFLKSNYYEKAQLTSYNVSIPHDPKYVLYTSHFKYPPVSTVIKFIVLKHLIMQFMRKYGEKMWAPLLFGKVGDPKSGQYPDTPGLMEEAIDEMLEVLYEARNHSVGAIAGNSDILQIEQKQNGQYYIDLINFLDEQILYGLFANITFVSGNSVYKGNEFSAEGYVRFIESIRYEYECALKLFWSIVVVPNYPIEKIKIEWPPVRSMTIKDISDAFSVFAENGVFIDAEERRNIASMVFPQIRERKATPEEIKRLDDIWIQMKSPSQPGQSTVSVVNKKGGKPKNPNNPEKPDTSLEEDYS